MAENLEIPFLLVRDIQGRQITLGDIVAHSVPVNSFEQINGKREARGVVAFAQQ